MDFFGLVLKSECCIRKNMINTKINKHGDSMFILELMKKKKEDIIIHLFQIE